jgi:hypothetical protein
VRVLASHTAKWHTSGTATLSAAQNDETPQTRNALRGLTLGADGVGFEPTVRFHVHTLSRRAP